jgi:hypothetical protein
MKKSLSKFSFTRITFLLCSAMALVLTGCLDKNNDDMPEPTPVAYISFYHGSPDAPDFNIDVDDERVNSQAFKYSNASNYIAITTGNHKIEFTPATTTDVVIDTTYNFKEAKIYSLFAVDSLQDIEMLLVQDSLVVPGMGNAAIRLIHLSPDAPAVDVAIAGGGATPVFTNLGFKGNTEFRNVPAGTHSFQVKETGTENALMTATTLSLEAGKNYTLIVRGFQTPPAGNSNVMALQIVRNY